MSHVIKSKTPKICGVVLAALVLLSVFVCLPFAWANAEGSAAGSGSVYIAAYNVVDNNGNEIVNLYPGDSCIAAFTVVDERIDVSQNTDADKALLASYVRATIVAGTFSSLSAGDITVKPAPDNGKFTYTIAFRGTTYQGSDKNFSFNVAMIKPNGAGEEVYNGLQTVTLTQSVAQCAKKDEAAATGAKPTIMVKDSSYGGTSVDAGQTFTLNLTSYNTSNTQGLTDITTSLSLPGTLTLAGGSNTTLTNKLAAGASYTTSFELQAQNSAETQVANITVQYVYYLEGSSEPQSASQMITVSIVQPDRFSFTALDLPVEAYAGEETTITLGFVNKGKGILYNLGAEISGNLKTPGQQQYVGNLQSGSEGSVDFTVASDTPGTVSGTITITYEDINGNEKTQTKDYAVTFGEMPQYNPPIFDDPNINGMEPQNAGMPWWGWALIGVGVVVVLVVGIKIIKKKKAKKLAAELAEDDDEDI